jgi:16S rRNA G1207 methylase RsmC
LGDLALECEIEFTPMTNNDYGSLPMSDVITQLKNAEAAKQKALSQLPAELGYASAQALAEAILRAAASKAAPAPSVVKASAVATKAGKVVAGGKGRRVPDSVRAEIAAALKAGETAAKLPKKFGVSYNVIHEVKKKIGMVTARG